MDLKYNRQIRLFGKDVQNKLNTCTILYFFSKVQVEHNIYLFLIDLIVRYFYGYT